MTQYDPNVIYKYAAGLYGRAQMFVIVYTLAGLLTGISLGKTYGAYKDFVSSPPSLTSLFGNSFGTQPPPPPSSSSNWALLGAIVCGLFGFWTGSSKAFALKLQAQTALCQVKIEENTKQPEG